MIACCQGAASNRIPAQIAQDQSRYTTHAGEQQALQEHLSQNVHAASSHRQPRADLPLPGCGASEQKIRQVHARQQQHQPSQGD